MAGKETLRNHQNQAREVRRRLDEIQGVIDYLLGLDRVVNGGTGDGAIQLVIDSPFYHNLISGIIIVDVSASAPPGPP